MSELPIILAVDGQPDPLRRVAGELCGRRYGREHVYSVGGEKDARS